MSGSLHAWSLLIPIKVAHNSLHNSLSGSSHCCFTAQLSHMLLGWFPTVWFRVQASSIWWLASPRTLECSTGPSPSPGTLKNSVMGETMSFKKPCSSLNSLYLCMWPYLEIRSSQIEWRCKLRWGHSGVRQVLNPMTWCLCKERNVWGPRDEENIVMSTETGVMHR